MPATSLRPQIVQVMAAHRERPLTTEEIYERVAGGGVAGFDPKTKRDRNLVNRELSDLADCSTGSPQQAVSPAPHQAFPRPLHLQSVQPAHGSVTVQTWWGELDESRLIAVSLSVSNGDSPRIFALQTLGSPQV